MKKIVYIICLLLLVSCSVSRQVSRYSGTITFFLPNGQTEEYDADYTKTRETKGNKTRVNESFNLHIGDDIVIAKDIPSFYVGHLVKPGEPIEMKTIVLRTENGEESIRIPERDFFELAGKANRDKDRLKEMLSDYLFEQTGVRHLKENIIIPLTD